jgi:hypothetical protein
LLALLGEVGEAGEAERGSVWTLVEAGGASVIGAGPSVLGPPGWAGGADVGGVVVGGAVVDGVVIGGAPAGGVVVGGAVVGGAVVGEVVSALPPLAPDAGPGTGLPGLGRLLAGWRVPDFVLR